MTQLVYPTRQKGSVVIVALCFVAVLSIALASYLAVARQAMKLSNRTYLKSVSRNLAEMGLEKALWAYNRNSWDSSIWTTTISGTVPIATLEPTISVPATLYGNGVAGTVKVQVLNYDSVGKGLPWKSSKAYTQNDVVTFDGVSNWNNTINYSIGAIVRYGGGFYRCILTHIGQAPPNLTYWLKIPDVADFRAWYRFKKTVPSLSQSPPDSIDWELCTPTIYAEGITTPPLSSGTEIKTQLRGTVSLAPLFPNALAATSNVDLQASGIIDSYNSDPSFDAANSIKTKYGATSHTFSAIVAGGKQVRIANASVYGYVEAPSSVNAPYAPVFPAGGGAKVTGILPGSGIDTTRVSRSPSIPQFAPSIWYASSGFGPNDVVRDDAVPGRLYCNVAPSWPAPTAPLLNTTYWKPNNTQLSVPDTISVGDGSLELRYVAGSLSLNSASDIITIDTPSILDIQGDLTITQGKIVITPNGSAEVHFNGKLTIDNSGGGFENQTFDPKKLLIVRVLTLPPNTENTFNSAIRFYGGLYLPGCSLSIGSSARIYGAVSADNITFPDSAYLHYDTSLRLANYHSIDTTYILTEWRELIDPTEKVTFPVP
jgi:hypothetical protein